MAITVNYPNGIGGSLGSSIATCKPLLTSGSVWYVNSTGGVNAASPAGQNREKPLLTLAQAVTNAAAGDIIVLMDGCVVALTGVQAISGLTVVGEGSANGIPTATITFNGAGTLQLGSSGTELHNVRITARTSASGSALARVSVLATSCVVRDCYFDFDQYDDGPGLSVATAITNCFVRSCTFVSVATVVTSQPLLAMSTVGSFTDLRLEDLTFDSGTVGWSNYWALDLSAGAITRLVIEGLSLLRGADARIHASSTGRVNVQTATGGARIG